MSQPRKCYITEITSLFSIVLSHSATAASPHQICTIYYHSLMDPFFPLLPKSSVGPLQLYCLSAQSLSFPQKHYQQGTIDSMLTKTGNPECASSTALNFRFKRIKDYVYDMEAVLGKGNFSTVYQAVREHTNELYAVKVVKLASLTFKKLEELLEQEIAIIRSLDHPNVIRCAEVLKSTNHCYFITELCQGGNLQKTLKERGPMAEEEIWAIISQIYQGLKYLSSKNIIHRDIKPANIFVTHQTLKIADFGFAIMSSESFNDFSIGSPLYMSPQGYVQNLYGPKTDVWAFGVLVYEMLHGKQPLLDCKNDQELKTNICKNIRDEQFKKDVSAELKEFIKRCLEVDESKRITFEEMEKTAYFQRYNNIRSMAEIKMVNAVRRPSMPLLKNIVRAETSLRHIEETPKRTEPKASDKQNNARYKQPLRLPIRTQKRRTKLLNIDLKEIQQNKSLFVECCSKDLLRGDLMFNQSIGLIHFCRIGYKLSQEDIGEDLGRCVKAMIIKILSELQIRVNLGIIKYDQQENRPKKENKLKLVIREYLSKYQKELKGDRKPINLYETVGRLHKYLQELEKNIQFNLYKCYLAMLFAGFTEELVRCIQGKSYKLFGENGVIDACLEEKVLPKRQEDYQTSKKKYYRAQKI